MSFLGADTARERKALIVGFIGRHNSGDEMMLEMHMHLLKKLGFSQIDVTTEVSEDVPPGYRYLIKRFDASQNYELVLIGGGALSPGYGFFPAAFFKFERNAKVIFSSINIPSFKKDYLNMLCSLGDLILTRSKANYEKCKEHSPKIRYLPDVSTIYKSDCREAGSERIAVVIRNEAKAVFRLRPMEPFDVLVLSRMDEKVSRDYAHAHRAPVKNIYKLSPQRHFDTVAGYERIISVGRFHAAVYAAAARRDVAYYYPEFAGKIPEEVKGIDKPLSWEEIKEIGKNHLGMTKAGVRPYDLIDYCSTTEQDYLNAFSEVLNATGTVNPFARN